MKAYEVVATILGVVTPMVYKSGLYATLRDSEAVVGIHEQMTGMRVILTRMEQELDESSFRIEYRVASTGEIFLDATGKMVEVSREALEAALKEQEAQAMDVLSNLMQPDVQDEQLSTVDAEYSALLRRVQPTGRPH